MDMMKNNKFNLQNYGLIFNFTLKFFNVLNIVLVIQSIFKIANILLKMKRGLFLNGRYYRKILDYSNDWLFMNEGVMSKDF